MVGRLVERWASGCERPLPWRGERDPYRVLVSEVMLQQTQAARVAAAYPAFLSRFPDAAALARAGSAGVLRAWGNLGYNRRAVALWRACRAIVDAGFPRTVDELERLPGVGPYTARAVASFAFACDVGVVDANVRRVLTRLYGLAPDADVQAFADELVPGGRSAVWNQAMIDLGALVCRPRSPSCSACPLARRCAFSKGRRAPARTRAREPAFEATPRYVRGRIVAELRLTPRSVGLSTLRERVGVSPDRFASAVRALERDGIVSLRGGRVSLGAAPTAPSTEAPRGRKRGTASRRG